jgi:AcrR family transcriptional regulator
MPAAVSSSPPGANSTRERILDAAATVMRDVGLARATTKEIARAAGYSEALLYKHFADKQDIYMGVLRERAGAFSNPTDLIGVGVARDNLVGITTQLMRFYVKSFPMSASIFSSPDLLAAWRDGLAVKGAGPEAPIKNLELYLRGEIEAERLRIADASATAALLCGAAFQHAFLACFHGLAAVPDEEKVARRLVDAVVG